MNKYAVVTISIGKLYENMRKLTHPFLKAYAKKLKADFIVIDKTNCTSPHWEKFQIYKFLDKYERILFVDSDILIRQDAPNIFDIVPSLQIGAFDEAPFTGGRRDSIIQACNDYNTLLPNWNGKYFNTGVMVISKHHKDLFEKPEKEAFNFYEQGYLNLVFSKSQVPMFELDYKFNRMSCMDTITGEERFASYFIHYAGFPDVARVCSIIENDKKKLEKDYPNFNYKRHILVNVQGGLGDQIDVEPAIRYMKKYIYPNDDIKIKTHFPRLFQHLNIPTFHHDDFRRVDDTPYYEVITLPGPETLQWAIVSNLMCHTVDYCSMALLKRTLPTADKQIQLLINKEDYQQVYNVIPKDFDFKSLVLIHAGRHWQSKTFPKQWWQDLIDGLHRSGVKVCLIGKDEDTRGVQDLKLSEGMIDTRNKLSLGGLIALISMAKILISNDSAPIHIAGAFNNDIILIPTCKHPDHLLPFRSKGRQVGIYKKLTLDDALQAPTELYSSSAEFIKGDWAEYLPHFNEIINQVKRYFEKNG